MAEKEERKDRDKIFDDKKPVNISGDILKVAGEDAIEKRLYVSQVIDQILRSHYSKGGRL